MTEKNRLRVSVREELRSLSQEELQRGIKEHGSRDKFVKVIINKQAKTLNISISVSLSVALASELSNELPKVDTQLIEADESSCVDAFSLFF